MEKKIKCYIICSKSNIKMDFKEIGFNMVLLRKEIGDPLLMWIEPSGYISNGGP